MGSTRATARTDAATNWRTGRLPAITMMAVKALIDPDMLIEIEATAVIPD